MAATCAISAIPIVGSFIGTGAKAAILGMRVGTKISSEFVQTMFKTMSHTYKAGRAAGKVTDGALLLKAVVKESATSATKELAQFAVTHNAMIGMGVGFIGKNADEVVEGAAKVGRKSGSTSNLRLSEKVRELKNKGDYRQALDIHYEDLIRRKTGGQSQILQGREYDVVTDTKLIQAKRSNAAINNPNNFLKGSTRKQIKETARVANELGLQPEYWFKYGVHPKVREYIESKGIKVIIGFED